MPFISVKLQGKIAAIKSVSVSVFILLILSIALLDQSTKRHAEKSYLSWSHPQELHSYRSSSTTILSFGDINFTRTNGTAETLENMKKSHNWFALNFTYVRNTGAIWGMMQNLPKNLSNIFFVGVYPIFVVFLLFIFRSTHPGQRILRLSIALIIGGALGNFIDRIFVGYVIDWIHPEWLLWGWQYSYPVFNVADMSIVLGVFLWFLDSSIDTKMLKKVSST